MDKQTDGQANNAMPTLEPATANVWLLEMVNFNEFLAAVSGYVWSLNLTGGQFYH